MKCYFLAFVILVLFGKFSQSIFADELDISRLPLLERVSIAANYDKYDPKSQEKMKIAWDSINTTDMPILARELTEGSRKGEFWIFRIFARKISSFDAEGLNYNRDECVEAIIRALEMEENESYYARLMTSLKGLNDSKIMYYIKERDSLADSSAIRVRAELLEMWNKQVSKERPPRGDRTELEEKRSGEVRSSRSMDADADENSKKKKPILIAFAVMLIAVCAWVIQRFRRVA